LPYTRMRVLSALLRPRTNGLKAMTITGTGGERLQRRSLGNWAALACLTGILGCGGPTAVQPPVNNTVSVPQVPTKTVDPAKSKSGGGGISTATPTPPAARLFDPEELQRVVTALANDDPEQPLKRVWIRNDASQERVVDVVLSNSLVTDDGLAKLAGIARLRHLNLDNCREITSEGVAHLKSLPDLRKLSLNRTGVGDAGLAHLADLPLLTELSLVGDAGVTDAGAAYLARCRELRVLRLQDTHLGDKGLVELQAAPQLRELYLDGSRVTEKGLAAFAAVRPDTLIIHPLRPEKRAP
jgi:Leucine Rich repeat